MMRKREYWISNVIVNVTPIVSQQGRGKSVYKEVSLLLDGEYHSHQNNKQSIKAKSQSTIIAIQANQSNNTTHHTMTAYSNPFTMVNGSADSSRRNSVEAQAQPEARRSSSSASVKNAWQHVKESAKELHTGLNAAYEQYYGPARFPPTERRSS